MAGYADVVKATAGLVSLWELGEAAGNFADSKDANPGSLKGEGSALRTQPSILATEEGHSLSLDNDYVGIPKAANLNLGDVWSLEIWVKPLRIHAGEGECLIGKGQNAYYLRIGPAGQVELLKSQVSVLLATAEKLTVGQTYHIVGVKNGKRVVIYVDGEVWASGETGTTTENNELELKVGADQRTAGDIHELLDATVEYAAVYNIDLSQTTVLEHYEAVVHEPEPEPEPEPEAELPAPETRHGYPDWQRLNLRLTQPLCWRSGYAPESLGRLGPFYVGNIPSVAMLLAQTAGTAIYTVTLQWASDRKFTAPYFTEEFLIGPTNGVLERQFPCRGAWLRVTLSRTYLAAAATFNALIVPADSAITEPRLGNPLLIAGKARKVAASGTAEVVVPSVVPGRANLLFDGTNKSVTVSLQQLEANNTYGDVMNFYVPNFGTSFFAPVTLPRAPVRLFVHNFVAEEYEYFASLAFA